MSGRPLAICQTIWASVRHYSKFMTDTYKWSLLFSLSDILCVLNPAGQNVRQGLSSLPQISRSLPDMSGMSSIFRNHWKRFFVLAIPKDGQLLAKPSSVDLWPPPPLDSGKPGKLSGKPGKPEKAKEPENSKTPKYPRIWGFSGSSGFLGIDLRFFGFFGFSGHRSEVFPDNYRV